MKTVKLEQLTEARYAGKPTPLAWFEIGRGRGEPYSNKTVVELEKLDRIFSLPKGDELGEAWENYFDDKEVSSIGELYERWPEARKSLRKTGEWSDTWEEGAFGLSSRGMKTARRLAAEAFTQIDFEDEEDWE